MKKTLITALIGAALLLSGCSQRATDAGAYYSYATRCLGTELDGSYTLLAWGEGRNKQDAVEQAQKNAVRDVLFRGVHAGVKEREERPVLNEPNAQEKYEEYFNIFFADGGEYRKYVSGIDERRRSKQKESYHQGRKYSTTVRVNRAALKARLKADGVLR